MQLDWISAFVRVADERSFVRAAHAAGRSQSRISTHVALLEDELGVVLVDRTSRPVRLTEAGEAFLGRARDVLHTLTEARAELDAFGGRVQGSVRVASIASVAAIHLPALIDRFGRLEPNVRIEVAEAATDDIPLRVIARRADLGIAPRAYVERHPELIWTALWREPIHAVLPLHHALAGRTTLTLDDLAGHDLITPGSADGARGLSPEIAPILAAHGVNPSRTRRVASPSTLVALVRVGLGVGLLSELAVRTTAPSGVTVLAVDELRTAREIVLARTRHGTTTPASAAFTEFITRAGSPL